MPIRFFFVPTWIGLHRPDLEQLMILVGNEDDVMVKIEVLKLINFQHSPFTLQFGGLLHLAFGAILTGSVLNK
jgi:hypothetical protein